jgi:hypothetical protein
MIRSDPQLSPMDHSAYIGWYHTDVSVPTEYFRGDWGRPASVAGPLLLDFSYLFARRGRDYREMAEGVPHRRGV